MIVRAEHGTTTQCVVAIERCFEKCCRDQTPLTLINPDSDGVCRGRFVRLTDDRVVIRVLRDRAPLSSERFCCVIFDYESRRWAFCTSIVGMIDAKERELVLALPRQVVTESRRPATRLSIPQESGLSAVVKHSGKTYYGRVLNINTYGSLIEFEDSVMDINLNSLMELVLHLDGNEVVVPAHAVRRERWHRLGFAFHEGDNAPEDWKARLRLILRKVDSDWLRSEGLKSDQHMYVDLCSVRIASNGSPQTLPH